MYILYQVKYKYTLRGAGMLDTQLNLTPTCKKSYNNSNVKSKFTLVVNSPSTIFYQT